VKNPKDALNEAANQIVDSMRELGSEYSQIIAKDEYGDPIGIILIAVDYPELEQFLKATSKIITLKSSLRSKQTGITYETQN